MKCHWYKRTIQYIGEVCLQNFETIDKLSGPVSVDEAKNTVADIPASVVDDLVGKHSNVQHGEVRETAEKHVDDMSLHDGNDIFEDDEKYVEVGQTSTFNHDDVGQQSNIQLTVNENQQTVTADVPEATKFDSFVNAVVSHDKSVDLPTFNKESIQAEVHSIKRNLGGIEKGVGSVEVQHLLDEISSLKSRIGVVERVVGIIVEDKLVVPKVISGDADGQNKVIFCDFHCYFLNSFFLIFTSDTRNENMFVVGYRRCPNTIEDQLGGD